MTIPSPCGSYCCSDEFSRVWIVRLDVNKPSNVANFVPCLSADVYAVGTDPEQPDPKKLIFSIRLEKPSVRSTQTGKRRSVSSVKDRLYSYSNSLACPEFLYANFKFVFQNETWTVTGTAAQADGSLITVQGMRASAFFRRIDLHIATCDGLLPNGSLPNLVSESLPDGLSAPPSDPFGLPEAAALAGISLNISHLPSNLPNLAAGWTVADLAQLLNELGHAHNAPRWSLCALLARRFKGLPTDFSGDGDSVAGIMFDDDRLLGPGPDADLERQAFAVFRDHHWFAPQEAHAVLRYLFVWMHEMGHAFNLPHIFDNPRRADLASWMNYFSRAGGEAVFWPKFKYHFDGHELLALRHYPPMHTAPGGVGFGTGGAMRRGFPPLELLLRSKEVFQLMEPVFVEVRLRNISSNEVVVTNPLLHPAYDIVRIEFRPKTPQNTQHGGGWQAIGQPIKFVVDQVSRTLAPGSSGGGAADRLSRLVPVFYNSHAPKRFTFDAPGEYQLRAFYRTEHGEIIHSDIHTIDVQAPGKKLESVTSDFFQPDVAANLWLGGSGEKRFDKVNKVLLPKIKEKCDDDYLRTMLTIILASAIARNKAPLSRKGAQYKGGKHNNFESALTLWMEAQEHLHNAPDKYNNLPYRHLVLEKQIPLLHSLGHAQTAEQEKEKLLARLSERGVKDFVLKGIRDLG